MTPTLEHVEAWASELESLHARFAARFVRSEPRRRALAYLQGLLSPLGRKNGWQLAERAGELSPDGMQRLLGSASWDEAGVRDDLRAYVLENLRAEGAVLVVDETGFLKKGEHSVGVKRQYSGTKGGIDNCQVGVFLAYASDKGTAFIDRELFLPQEWALDTLRRREGHVPDEVEFASKSELATRMLMRALDAGVRPAWVVGDSVYAATSLRRELERRQQPYVLAVTSGAPVRYWDGYGLSLEPVAKVFARLPKRAWRRLSAGAGSKGERIYDWAWVRPTELGESGAAREFAERSGLDHWFLARRNRKDQDITYYLAYAPLDVKLEALVGAAGSRWQIEVGFEALKQEAGLDEYEVRSWTGWYRHVTLALVAHAFLAVIRAQEAQKGGPGTSSV